MKQKKNSTESFEHNISDKVLKNGPRKIFQRLSSTNFTWSILQHFISFNTNLQLSDLGK